jgi:hypothetical protein
MEIQSIDRVLSSDTYDPLPDCIRPPRENAESAPEPEPWTAPVAPSALQLHLLADLRACLPERTKKGERITRIGTSGVLRLLQSVPGSRWLGLLAHKLARMLGSLGIHPHVIRFTHGVRGVRRGYVYDELRWAFLTRLPLCENPGLMRGPNV